MKKTFFPFLLIAVGVLATTVCNALDTHQVYVSMAQLHNTYQVFNNSTDTVYIESVVVESPDSNTCVHTYVQPAGGSITSHRTGNAGSVIRHHTAVAPGTLCVINYALDIDSTATLKVIVRGREERCAYIIKP